MHVKLIDTLQNVYEMEVEYNTPILDIIKDLKVPYPILLTKFDNQYRDLNHKIRHDCVIECLDMRDNYAWLCYQNTLVFVYKKAVYDVLGDVHVQVDNSLNKGLFTKIKAPFDKEDILAIEKRMREIIALKIPITKEYKDGVEIYTMDDYKALFYGLQLPDTSYITHFELRKYRNGVLLRYPHISKVDEIPPYEDQVLLYEAFSEAVHWEKLHEIAFVSDLNKRIKNKDYKDLIFLQEALFDKKFAEIANRIKEEKKHVVLISGPSSSGKTSFAQKLCVHLKVIGVKPLYLGTDDYFKERAETPLDASGNKDYETIDAVDIDLFNKQINDLLDGKKVDIPRFNFISGSKEFGNRITKMDKNQVIVIEGTHALNGILTSQIKDEEKFKIYISPLTSLNINSHNRIPTTDARMLRRLIRDDRTRGNSANDTIRNWQKVRRGEDLYIFPYMHEADVFFNTNYIYELSVLKKYAYPLLASVTRDTPEYAEAQRMLSFLRFFETMEDDSMIANNSILREFIGGSVLLDE